LVRIFGFEISPFGFLIVSDFDIRISKLRDKLGVPSTDFILSLTKALAGE